MNHVRTTRTAWRNMCAASQRTGKPSTRSYATANNPSIPPQPTPPASPPNPKSPPKQSSRVGAYYKTFSYPVFKTFLIALFTYQITYYAWLKLEVIEDKHALSAEVADLQHQLRDALARQKDKAGDVVDEVVGKVGDYAEETKEAGRAVVESVREGGEEVGKTAGTVGKVAQGGWWPW